MQLHILRLYCYTIKTRQKTKTIENMLVFYLINQEEDSNEKNRG